MKILSKYKDYYDYLIGIYGVDKTRVLDRRIYEIPTYYSTGIQRLFIGDHLIEGYYYKNKFFWGEDLALIAKEKNRKLYDGRVARYVISNEYERGAYIYCSELTYMDNLKVNTFHKSAILLEKFKDYSDIKNFYRYPILTQLGIQRVISAEQIFLLLTDFLAPKEPEQDNMTDKEKILARGFDYKTSFRNM